MSRHATRLLTCVDTGSQRETQAESDTVCLCTRVEGCGGVVGKW